MVKDRTRHYASSNLALLLEQLTPSLAAHRGWRLHHPLLHLLLPPTHKWQDIIKTMLLPLVWRAVKSDCHFFSLWHQQLILIALIIFSASVYKFEHVLQIAVILEVVGETLRP